MGAFVQSCGGSGPDVGSPLIITNDVDPEVALVGGVRPSFSLMARLGDEHQPSQVFIVLREHIVVWEELELELKVGQCCVLGVGLDVYLVQGRQQGHVRGWGQQQC